MRLALMILWPSFLTAALAEGCFFSLFDPAELVEAIGTHAFSPLAIYSIGFFMFWSLCAIASMLTCYLIRVPADHQPPF